MHASQGPFFTCPPRCALAKGCKHEPQHAGISACMSGSVLHLSPEVCTCRRLQKRIAAGSCKSTIRACISGSVPHLSPEVCTCRRLQKRIAAGRYKSTIRACISGPLPHLSPEVCTCGRLQKRTAAGRYKCMRFRVRSSPVPGGVHVQKAAKTNRSTQVQVHACRGPFLTCPRRSALAEGCKNEPQHAGISACISGSVLHLSPEVCTCKRLQTRTAARRYKCMHVGVRSSPVPGGVHLQKAAKTNRSRQL